MTDLDNVSADRLPLVVTALDHPLRLQIIAVLRHGRRYVSALARDLGISRPLLYMHLDRLEKAGLVTSSLELGEDGKAVKWYELQPFELRVTADVVAEAVRHLSSDPPPGKPKKDPPR